MDRGVFSPAALEAEGLLLTNPDEYFARLERGYVRGVQVDRPAVIAVNTTYAGLAVLELLARLHPFRMDDNGDVATIRLSVSHLQLETEPDGAPSARLLRRLGRREVEPPLDMPSIGRVPFGEEPQ